MDTYTLINKGNTNIVGTVTGPGTWCYIKKNGKKGKVKQVYAGAKFMFSNINYPDIKAYEITGSFHAIQRDLVSGEVQRHPKVVESEISCKCKDEITLLKEKINELTSRCDKLEATLVMPVSSLTPNNPFKKPRRRNRHKPHRYSCAMETPEFVLSDVIPYCIRPIKLSHVLYNCVDFYHTAKNAAKVDIIYPGKEYDETIVEDLLAKFSLFIRGGVDEMQMQLVDLQNPQKMQDLFTWVDTVFGEYPPNCDVGETFQLVFESHSITKVIYSLIFVKINMDYLTKAFYATYLKWLYTCREYKYHPFNDARLAEFYEVNFKRVAP